MVYLSVVSYQSRLAVLTSRVEVILYERVWNIVQITCRKVSYVPNGTTYFSDTLMTVRVTS